MKQAKRAIAIAVFAVTAGCTGQLYPATPPDVAEVLPVYHTQDTGSIVYALARTSYEAEHNLNFEIQSGNHRELLTQLSDNQINTFISHHNPATPEQNYWSVPLVQDGIALIVHPSNPVSNITIDQLQGIYRGFITNWSELGGIDRNISLYSRERGAGLRLEFERLVMGQQQTSPNARVLSSSQLMIEQISLDSGSIGYIPISLLTQDTKPLAIDTILPSVTSIADNRYALRSTIYLIGQEEASEHYQQFIIAIQNLQESALSGVYAPLPR